MSPLSLCTVSPGFNLLVTPIHHYTNSFYSESANYRGHIFIDGTLHHPTFSHLSNVIGSTQNHVIDVYSFIHEERCWQEPSLQHFHRLHHTASQKTPLPLPMMPFQHAAVPQDQKTSIISLAQIHFSGALFFFFFFSSAVTSLRCFFFFFN